MNEERKQKRVNRIAVFITLLLATAITVTIVVCQQRKKKIAEEAIKYKQEYAINLDLATYTMLSGAADAEVCCNLIVQVWSNSIWEKEDQATDKYTRPNGFFEADFNDALSNLFMDTDFCVQINNITDNQETVNEVIKELKNPPEEYEAAYECLFDCYDAYLIFTNLAVRPTGSLETFSSDFDDADTNFMHCYDVMKFYL